ncbi:T9SS type A sorting domain-containing protein [Mucilaginibacter limnophilus]|uniref:T9SS type A sorting domain-containing protein n=1 Tax=Mucilaginibacter limnophilus TaxID=1932778 RepID=A0A3S2V3K0_9SPHI|nr:malectin domain-containing carbohydrate-binding protein [Mucilaginibacter limnophilus]RVU02460.1 T9SS type A sorting domain-containing protein [Mucilaginibacter limnophilus]
MLKGYLLTGKCIALLLLLTIGTAYGQTPCSPVSPLSCDSLTVALPYNLSFDAADSGTIADKNGFGTGFTTINTYSGTRLAVDGTPFNPQVPGYEPSKITLTGGRLQLVTNKGIDYQANNNLLNMLGISVNAVRKLQLDVKVINPFNGTQSQQAGLWYGLNDKTFIKLSIAGNKVEFRKELNDVTSTTAGTGNPDQRITGAISGLNNQTVTLRIVIDSIAGTAEGFYSTDGVTFISTGASYATKTLNIAGMGITDSAAYAGIYATHRNATSAVTYNFDDFSAISIFVPNPPDPPAFCGPISTLPCDSIKVSLPFTLDFNSAIANTLADKSGQGTGFRTVNTYSGTRLSADGTPSNPQVPGYEPSKITLTGGRLQLVTNKGIDYLTNNNMLNVLGVKINTARKLQMDLEVINPYNGTQSQQAGLWYGLNDKTFIKLGITGNKVELRKEENDVASTASGTSNPDQRITAAISGLNNQTVRLRLVIDSVAGIAEGFYSTDGVNYVSTGNGYPSSGINITGMGIVNTEAFAGIYGTHRNGTSAVTYNFDNFALKSLKVTIPEQPQPSGAYMVLRNMDGFPADDQLVMSFIQTPWRRTSPDTTPYNANHDKARLRISNKGTAKLTLNALTLSNTSAWKIAAINSDSTATLPVSINSGSYVDVTVQFKAVDAATRLKIFNDTLTVASNDGAFPSRKVVLHGIWQKAGESTNEPYAQQIINAFGFTTNTGYGHDDGNIDGKSRVPNSSEVNASYFVRADVSKPVKVVQLAAYHGCCASVESFRYFTKGTTSNKTVFTHHPLDGQSVIPRLISSSLPAQGTFTPTGVFGIRVGSSSTDRNQNADSLIGIRVLKVYDGNGNLVPNAYFLNGDYLGTTFTNYDYQDNIYYVENIKPETGSANYSELAVQPVTAVTFAPTLTGETATFNLTLKNLGMTYPDGTKDPSIKIKSRVISGPNAGEFELGTLSATTVAIQTTATLTVRFKPSSVGIKNAVLIITHDNLPTPMRIPLYGIANSATSTVSAVKRVKGASDVNRTIGDIPYETDKNYRKGSIKLDKQSVIAGIAGTDVDSLYQTYLSAATDLAETRYEIPVANGDYQVRLHFAELYWTTPGSRVFGINIENQLVLQNFDIFKEVGFNSAIVKDFNTTVNDGVLTIKFNPTANRTSIAAVELFKVNTVEPLMAMARTASITAPRSISVYPNPSVGGSFTLNVMNFTRSEKVSLSITNMAGRVVQTQIFYTDDNGKADVYVPMSSSLGKGMYIVNATTATGNIYTKLLVN